MGREGDVVLIYYEDQPSVFARIESVEPDIKKHWYQVTLLLLAVPARTVTWILRGSYIDGAPFTMGGRPVRLEEVKRVSVRKEPEDSGQTDGKGASCKGGRTVIPFRKPLNED